jgi:hypothetical protein
LGWEILASSLLSFTLGIFAAIVVKRWEIGYLRPVILIEDGITCREIMLDGVPFIANRIRVRNKGRKSAQGCKAYVESAGNDIERTGWMLPDNDNAYTLALNVDIPEHVDLCAISNDAKTRVITLERGYRDRTIESCRTIPPGDHEIMLRITSSNGRPAARRIRIYDTYAHFPGEIGRIVEFIC